MVWVLPHCVKAPQCKSRPSVVFGGAPGAGRGAPDSLYPGLLITACVFPSASPSPWPFCLEALGGLGGAGQHPLCAHSPPRPSCALGSSPHTGERHTVTDGKEAEGVTPVRWFRYQPFLHVHRAGRCSRARSSSVDRLRNPAEWWAGHRGAGELGPVWGGERSQLLKLSVCVRTGALGTCFINRRPGRRDKQVGREKPGKTQRAGGKGDLGFSGRGFLMTWMMDTEGILLT